MRYIRLAFLVVAVAVNFAPKDCVYDSDKVAWICADSPTQQHSTVQSGGDGGDSSGGSSSASSGK